MRLFPIRHRSTRNPGLARQIEIFLLAAVLLSLQLLLLALPAKGFWPQRTAEEIEDVTNKYHFLSADDTLALLEEEGKLHGYIDVYQGEEESDTVLSYAITSGSRKGDHVEFKTNKIHQKYYRFTGSVQRGTGTRETDPDYLRLVGDLEIVTTKSGGESEAVQRMHLVLKSLGREEAEEK